MGANPHANGGLLLRDLSLPDFRDYAVAVDAPGTTSSEATRVLGGVAARRHARQRRRGQLPRLRSRRDRLQPARARCSRRPTARGWPSVATATTTSPRTAASWRSSSEHLCQGWLEGYLLTGRHGAVQLLRGLHPHRGLDVQPAREVAEGHARDPVAAADRVAELPAVLARLAPGPQRLLPPGPGLHRSRGQQEGRDHPRLPAARRQHAAVGHGPLPAQPRLRQRRGGGQAARAELAVDGRRHPALHARDRHVGLGEHRRGRRARRRPGLRRRRPDARGAGRRRAAARAPARAEGARRQRRRPHAPAERRRASPRPLRPRVRRALHAGPAR